MTRSLALAIALVFAAGSALAQAPAQPAAKAPAKAAPAKKPAPKKKKEKAEAPAEKPLPPADAAQLEAAERTFYGPYECEFDQKIDIAINARTPGYVDVKFGKNTYVMKPVLSTTGALRLEDVTGRTLMLQIANKSMLMDVKAGRRLVDACIHEKQRGIAEGAFK